MGKCVEDSISCNFFIGIRKLQQPEIPIGYSRILENQKKIFFYFYFNERFFLNKKLIYWGEYN